MRFVQIGGLVIFAATFLTALLFAEGYQYDSGSSEIVKKGVIFFEGFSAGEGGEKNVLLNGEPVDVSFPGELRVVPGEYNLEFRCNGYFPWKKHIEVPEDRIVRFAEIQLLPEILIKPRILESTDSFSLYSVLNEEVALFNSYLDYIKTYVLGPDLKFEIRDVGDAQQYAEDIAEGAKDAVQSIGLEREVLQIGKTFHILFVTSEFDLMYCDEDFENCRKIAKLDSDFIQSSKDGRMFFVMYAGHFAVFDFTEKGQSLPDLIEDFVFSTLEKV